MTLILPGFPTCSEKIETPDIAELLFYPNFIVADADTVWKYGSDFQRKLLSSCNLKHNRKHVTVYSGVHIVSPHARPITKFYHKNTRGLEWHIDGLDSATKDHHNPDETVHLFLANASRPTEFQKTPIEIDDPEVIAMNRNDFTSWINHGGFHLIDGAPIENGRIYEFSNHIHRALVPNGPEFRFTFRVRETDRVDMPTIEQSMPKHNKYWDIDAQEWRSTIRQGDDGSVLIKYPKHWLDYTQEVHA